MPTFLSIGAGNASPAPLYSGWEGETLDLNPEVSPTFLLDARVIHSVPHFLNRYDSVYLSHVLEHFTRIDGRTVLKGAYNATKEGGFCFIRVPSVELAMEHMLENRKDLDDPLGVYETKFPVTYRQLVNGLPEKAFMEHKCHYSPNSLRVALEEVGFRITYGTYYRPALEVILFGFKGNPDPKWKELLDIR